MNKEEIYDARLYPLMEQILTICKENKIAMLADFFIPAFDGDNLHCITSNLQDECEPSDNQLKALDILYKKRNTWSLLMTTHGKVAEMD